MEDSVRRQQHLVLLISILASVVTFLDGSIVNVALPAIVRNLGGGLSAQQWMVDAYLITLGALILVAGSLSDLFGRKRILYVGLVGFAISSLLCAIAPTDVFLIISRGLQGIAGALLVPSSLALIISAYSGAAQSKAIGSWTAWTGVGFIFGPLLGGFLVDATSWRYIFVINMVPIGVTLWLLTKLAVPEKIRRHTKIDTLGAILCAVGLGGPVFGLIEQPRYGWGSPLIYVSFTAGVAIFTAFIGYEKRLVAPMLPLSLFRVRNFSVGNIATAAIYGGLSIATFLIVIFVQQVGGFSAWRAGLALLPVTIVMFSLSRRFGALAGKFGPRLLMTAGPLVAALGFLLMLGTSQPLHYWSQLFPGVVVFALGLSMTVSPLTSAVLSDVDTVHAGVASATNNAISRIAGLITTALIGIVVGDHLDVAGFHRAIVVTAGLVAAGGVISAVGITNKRPHQIG